MMNKSMNARDTLLAFCRCWFEQRNLENTAAFLTDDISFIGTGEGEQASGLTEMTEYLRQDMLQISKPFSFDVSYINEQMIAPHVCNIFMEMTLVNNMYSWRLRGLFTLVETDCAWKISSMHYAEPGRNQMEGEHYPRTLVMENAAVQRDKLLNESLPGGIMGGYLEKGYPFYYINQRMLEYLGYESEAEFVKDIDGLLSNCVYPEDWPMLRDILRRELLEEGGSGEYVAEYRRRRKDGSFIWVHDIGRRTVAEDGRMAVNTLSIDITAQRRAQEELLNVYNNIPGAVFRCRFDKDFTVVDANDGLFDFLGYTREEFAAMGNCMSAVIFPEDYAIMADKLKAQLRDGSIIHNENRLICKNGVVKWVSIKGQLTKAEDGNAFFYCVFVDITEEKQLQERVKDLYRKELNYFAELSSQGGSVQGRINVTQNRVESYLATSDVAVAHVGDSYDEIIEHLSASVVDAAYGEEIRRALRRDVVLSSFADGKGEYHYDFLRRRNDAGLFWGSTSLRLHTNPEDGDVIMFFYTFDITEQKMQEKLLSRIAEVVFDAVADIDTVEDRYHMLTFRTGQSNLLPPQGKYTEEIGNLAAKFMDEEMGRVYKESLSFDYMREQLEKKDSYSFTAEIKDGRGGLQTKQYKVFYIDRNLGRVCMLRSDVTDVVRQEQKQREDMAVALAGARQASAAKSDFLSRMSHEIRTPMNAIIGMSAIAAQSIGDDEKVAECISKIGISSRFLLSLINDILDMSRIESGKMLLKNEAIPMEEFINGINTICFSQSESKGVEYECLVDPVLDDYYIGDAMKLQQMLVNILGNAVKFTDEGGKIIFSISEQKKTKNDAILRFVISDTGIGMDESYLPHIFETFSQESMGTTSIYGGTGLGLAIAKSIADMMDGRITVRSIKGVGSEFTIDVKLGITEEEKQSYEKKKQQEYNFANLKTLVVDDDVTVCESASMLLKEMGIEAEWVDSGYKAIDRVQDLWNQKKAFDMILIDWKMPDMDGIETARRIRWIVGPDVTIIIITAYDWASIEHEAKLAGVNMLISKPIFKSSLVSAFTKALGQKEEQVKIPENYDFTGKRVLLAEDNLLNTEIATMLLNMKGFEVETAENGLRALELFSKSEPGYYDAILMDIRMPLMDGLTAAVNIRHLSNKDAATVPIIAMTANAFDSDIEKSKAAGMNAHLAKPVEPERLYRILYDFIFRGDV